MKIEDIVGKNLLNVTIAEDDSYRFEFEDKELLYINAPILTDESGDEYAPGDLDNKGVRSVEFEDGELIITFVDDAVLYMEASDVKDRFGLEVELEDPEAGADMSDVDSEEEHEPEDEDDTLEERF